MSTKLSLDVFWRNLRQGGDAPFIVSDEGNTTYATFCQAVAGAMSAYRKSSMSAGDRVVISVAKEVEGCAAFVAAIIAGHVPVIVSADAARLRFDAICRAVEPACLVMPAGGARPDWTCPVIDSATFSQHAADGGEITPPAGDPSALAYILFTSGTTAEPSGVEITLANLLAHLLKPFGAFSASGHRHGSSTRFPYRIRMASCWDRFWPWQQGEASSARDHST